MHEEPTRAPLAEGGTPGGGDETALVRLSVSKIAQKAQLLEPGRTAAVLVIPAGRDRPAPMAANVTLEMPEAIQGARRLTLFDRMTEDAIGNMMEERGAAGDFATTPEAVFRQMHGLPQNATVSKASADMVNASMERLASTWITIDCKEHLQAARGTRIAGRFSHLAVKCNVITARLAEARTRRGREIRVWKIAELPRIYAYSKAVRQMAAFPRAALAGKRQSPQIAAMRYFVLQQMPRIRHKRNGPDTPDITYAAVFEATGDELATRSTACGRVKRSQRKRDLWAILDSLEECGVIKAWREAGKAARGQFAGVRITPAPTRDIIEPEEE